jgi:Zn-dependent protease with chaperone function
MKHNPKLPDDQVNLPKNNLLLYATKLFIYSGVFLIGIYSIIVLTINYTAQNITFEQEKQLMKLMNVDFEDIKEETEDPVLAPIIQKLETCANLPYDVKINIIEDPSPNAFAAPGGNAYVTRGFLDMVDSENELAYVLGHELGHFKNKDHLRKLGFDIVYGMVALILGDEYEDLANVTLNISGAQYSQAAELEADQFGLEVLNCSYGGVNGATKFFEKLSNQDLWSDLLSTHPAFTKRIEQINSLIDQNNFNKDNTLIPVSF